MRPSGNPSILMKNKGRMMEDTGQFLLWLGIGLFLLLAIADTGRQD